MDGHVARSRTSLETDILHTRRQTADTRPTTPKHTTTRPPTANSLRLAIIRNFSIVDPDSSVISAEVTGEDEAKDEEAGEDKATTLSKHSSEPDVTA